MSSAGIYDLRECGIWAIRNALEEQESEHVTPLMLEVVNLWLSNNGLWMENVVSDKFVKEEYGHGATSASATPVRLPPKIDVPLGVAAYQRSNIGKSSALDLARWRFWRNTLQRLADTDGQNEATAKSSALAARALGLMRLI